MRTKAAWKTSYGTLQLTFEASQPHTTLVLFDGSVKKVECQTAFPQIRKKNLPKLPYHLYPIVKRLSDGTFSATFYTRGIGGCWDWLSSCFGGAKEEEKPLHRAAAVPVSYEALVDPVPADPEIDIEALEQKLRQMDENNRKAFSVYADTYVPVVETQEDKTVDLEMEVAGFLDSEQQVFLLRGEAGTGKSLFLEYLSCRLHRPRGPIPLFISLPSLKNPRERCIEEALESMGFSGEEIAYLKQKRQFVFLLDAFDEIDLWQNLFATNHLSEWKCRVVISCRTQSLPANYLDLFAPYVDGRIRYGLLRERTTTPFSSDQIDNFLQKMIRGQETVWKDWADCRRCIDEIPGLIFLVQNPFVLTLVVRFLPEVLQRYAQCAKEEVTRLTRTELYRLFVQSWFNRQQEKLEQSGQIKGEDLRPVFLEFCKKLARKMHEEAVFCIIYEPDALFAQQANEWDLFFQEADPRLVLIRSGCPLRKVGNRWSFLHATILEFFISEKLFESLQHLEARPGDEESRALIRKLTEQLNVKLVVKQRSIIQFMADQAKSKRAFQNALLDIVMLSKVEPQVAIAAANAMTVLVAAGFSFSQMDLSGVRIPGADLSGGVFDGTLFHRADVRNVRFVDAFLRKAVLTEAQMTGVVLGQRPSLALNDKGFQVALSPDGQWIAVGRCGGVDIFDRASLKLARSIEFGWKEELKQILQFSKDGRFLVSSCHRYLISYPIVVIDCTTWECQPLPEVAEQIPSQQFAFIDPQTIFAVSCRKIQHNKVSHINSGFGIWDLISGKLVKHFKSDKFPHLKASGRDRDFSISPDGQILCMGGVLYNTFDLQKIADLPDCPPYANKCPFSPDGQRLAYMKSTSRKSSELAIYDVRTRKVVETHKPLVYYPMVFSPDGRRIAGKDGINFGHTICIYDLVDRAVVGFYDRHVEKIHDQCFSENGTVLFSVAEDRTVRIQEIGEETSVDRSDRTTVTSLSVCPERQLIAAVKQGQGLQFWDAISGDLLFVWNEKKYNCNYVRFLHGPSQYLAGFLYGGAHARVLTILDPSFPIVKKFSTAYEHDAIATPVAISPDGSCVVGARITDGKFIESTRQTKTLLRIWNIAQVVEPAHRHDLLIEPAIAKQLSLVANKIAHRLEDEIQIEPNYDLNETVFSPSGEFLAFSCRGNKLTRGQGYIGLFNRRTRVLERRIDCFSGPLLFSRDGQFFIFANNHNEICFYDMEAKAVKIKLPAHETRISALAISEDNTIIASGDCSGKISLWDIRNCWQITHFQAHLHWVIGLWFMGKAEKLISYSKDRIVRSWDLLKKGQTIEPSLQWASRAQFYSENVQVADAVGLSPGSALALQFVPGISDTVGGKYERW